MKQKINNNETHRKENKNKFFQNLFCLSKSENSAIATEVIRLCSLILPQYKFFFNGIDSLISEANKHKNKEPEDLSTVYENLNEQHLLTLDYMVAFISVQMRHTYYCQEQYDQYKALTLLVMMQLSCQGDDNHQRLCNELRQCALGNRKELTDYLPNILITNFSSLIDDLEKLQHAEALITSSIPGQLSNIKAPFQYIYQHRKKLGVMSNLESSKKKGNYSHRKNSI